MEKIDILFIAFVIFVIIVSCYIVYLRAGVNFLLEMLAKHHAGLEELLKAMEKQSTINEMQSEVNKDISKILNEVCNSSTGSVK